MATVDDIGPRDPLAEPRIPRRSQRLLKVPVGSRPRAPAPAPVPAPAAGPARSRRRVTTGRPHGLRDELHDSGKTIDAENTFFQGSGSGSGLDPYSIGPVDPDPYSESGSGSRRAKMTHKRSKNSCFEVLDGLFCELQASSITWTYFMEA